MSLQFVKALDLELTTKINSLTHHVMAGQLNDHNYIRMTAQVVAYKEVLSLARAILKRMGEYDEGDEGDNATSARGSQPSRL